MLKYMLVTRKTVSRLLLFKTGSYDVVQAGLELSIAKDDAEFKAILSLPSAETAGMSKHLQFHLVVLHQHFTD